MSGSRIVNTFPRSSSRQKKAPAANDAAGVPRGAFLSQTHHKEKRRSGQETRPELAEHRD
ncbi:hypothetical protein MCA0194 [Methylococcus capsulatus str. Bath]|uniref:Uncharacterized protein n=1 Tax=Methylococcus capsulatus (strain ATCC 33009 / NCIMB 11132 / Bath) TaxID=243233 RepID=Q60CB5_METCA|nr:hypothetical protein MCA0194 [Methylococcus capsulatus str. Bath]